MSLKPPTYANYPQFTEVFDATSPILRPWLAVFETSNTAEVVSIPAQGPNFYLTKIVSPGSVEVSFDSPGPNWSPCRPGMGFQGQNFRKVYLRRVGSAVAFDSVEFFTGSATMSNFVSTYRPPGRRTVTTILQPAVDGRIALANEKRMKLRLTGICPTPDSNGAAVVGFGNSVANAQINALEAFGFFYNYVASAQPAYNFLAASVSVIGLNRNTKAFITQGSQQLSTNLPQQTEIEIEDSEDVFMSCFDTDNLVFDFPTFAANPSFLRIDELIYD